MLLLSWLRDNIINVGIKLREHTPELFNEKEIKNKVTDLFKFVLS